MDMTKQTNVERFNHWMTDIVKSKWAHNENSMCHARAIVATHHIITANKKINGSN
jgi:hypothetical protein